MKNYLGCWNCIHFNKQGNCSAYKNIPLGIISGDVQHIKILKGQEGTDIYSPIKTLDES